MAATVVEKAFCVLELAKMNSVTLVQRHFRRRYGKPPSTRQSVYDWSKKFQETRLFIHPISCCKCRRGYAQFCLDRIRLSYSYLPCDKRLTHRTFVTLSYKPKNMYYKNHVSSILAKSLIISFQYNIQSVYFFYSNPVYILFLMTIFVAWYLLVWSVIIKSIGTRSENTCA